MLLVLCLMLGTLTMTSCNILTLIADGGEFDLSLPDLIPDAEPEVDEEPDVDPDNIYVEGGDTNNITINSNGSTPATAASKAILSVVSLAAEFERTYSSGWRQYTEAFFQYGSGVIYKLDKNKGEAYIITNYHVIHSADDNSSSKIARNISLYLYGMEYADYAITAEFVGGSLQYDLAVLKVKASSTLMSSLATAATVANSNEVAVLDTAIAIGNPDASGISATMGYVSVDSEEISLLGSDEKTTINIRVMRIDTPINGGNSGGGLFNDEGELIGIVNAKKTTSDGMGYAIPSNVAKNVADNIIDNCNGSTATTVQLCRLGVSVTASDLYTVYDEENGHVYRCERVKVAEFTDTSVANGTLKIGDIISSIRIDGVEHELTRTFHIVDAMITARVGDKVEFNITRDGVKQTVSLTLTEAALVEIN